MAVVNGINGANQVGGITTGRFTPQQNVGDINKSTRVAGQNQDNVVDLATSKTQYEDHQNDMFAHQRYIALQAYINYGREGVGEAAEPVITTATDVTDTSAAESYRTITGDDPSTSGQARAATAAAVATEPTATGTAAPTGTTTEPGTGFTEPGTESTEGEEESSKTSVEQNNKGIDGETLTEEEQAEVEDMKDRDAEVRTHENAHKSAGGQYAAAPSYTYETGPDGKRYITDGEVSIDVGEESDPQDTITKMQVVKRAALAPAQPSAQDRQVYAEASQKEAAARQELNEQKQEEAQQASGEQGASGSAAAQGQANSTSANNNAAPASADNGTAPASAEPTSTQGLAPLSRTIVSDESSLNPTANQETADNSTGVSPSAQPSSGSGISAINNQEQRNILDPASVPEPAVSTTKKFSA